MIEPECGKINIFNRIKCVRSLIARRLLYAAYLLALSEAQSASGPALA